MENFVKASGLNSDEADRRLFRTIGGHLIEDIIRVKHNDPGVYSMVCGRRYGDLGESEWRRLGYILGQNIEVSSLKIQHQHPNFHLMDVQWLCAGLQSNRRIQTLDLDGVDLQGTDKLLSLAPFLSDNSNLHIIFLANCSIGPDGINALANALSTRSDLSMLSLNSNDIGNDALHDLVLLVERNKKMHYLSLSDDRIGAKGCTSFARLLRNDGESNLCALYLSNNAIDNECAIILAGSLVKNTQLKSLRLDRNSGITGPGWIAFLHLVCDTSSLEDVLKSNHALESLSLPYSLDFEKVASAVGVDNASLLRASLELNGEVQNKLLVKRRKILWGHVRGNLNIGDSPIATCAMPRILAWIGDNSNVTGANLIQYHDPPLSPARMNTTRLDAIYRILQSRPALFPRVSGSEDTEHKTSHKRRRRSKRKANELDVGQPCDTPHEIIGDSALKSCFPLLLFGGSMLYGEPMDTIEEAAEKAKKEIKESEEESKDDEIEESGK